MNILYHIIWFIFYNLYVQHLLENLLFQNHIIRTKITKSKVLNTGLLRTEKTRGLEMILNMTWTYHQQLSGRTSQTCLQFTGRQLTLRYIDLQVFLIVKYEIESVPVVRMLRFNQLSLEFQWTNYIIQFVVILLSFCVILLILFIVEREHGLQCNSFVTHLKHHLSTCSEEVHAVK